MLVAILKREPRAGDEVLDGLGNEHLIRFGVRRNAGTDRNRKSCRLAFEQLALSCMETCSDFDPESSYARGDLQCAADRARGTVEGRVEAVARCVMLDAAPARQPLAHERVMALEEGLPRPVADRGLPLRRADDIGEQN